MKTPQKNTHRIEKINSFIQQVMGPILLENLQGFGGLVTISKVETSGDMKWAKIWISIFSGNSQGSTETEQPLPPTPRQGDKKKTPLSFDEKILKHLKDNIYDIQGELNEHFTTKIIPRISFHLDTTPRHAQHIDELIRKIHSEENPNNQASNSK